MAPNRSIAWEQSARNRSRQFGRLAELSVSESALHISYRKLKNCVFKSCDLLLRRALVFKRKNGSIDPTIRPIRNIYISTDFPYKSSEKWIFPQSFFAD
jgi:hypothetical protein